MRIIGGRAAGRILKAPKGFDVRPTPDLVRQAIFNSLGERVVGARVLELFGGTGALSLECLSRGAAGATCVELARAHARFIERNFAQTGIDAGKFQLRVQDVFTALPQLVQAGAQFDLIMADPPYSVDDAEHYQTTMVKRNAVMRALQGVAVGTHIVWLDQVLPMFRKDAFAIDAVIGMVKSTNHRFRMITIFRRVDESTGAKVSKPSRAARRLLAEDRHAPAGD